MPREALEHDLHQIWWQEGGPTLFQPTLAIGFPQKEGGVWSRRNSDSPSVESNSLGKGAGESPGQLTLTASGGWVNTSSTQGSGKDRNGSRSDLLSRYGYEGYLAVSRHSKHLWTLGTLIRAQSPNIKIPAGLLFRFFSLYSNCRGKGEVEWPRWES